MTPFLLWSLFGVCIGMLALGLSSKEGAYRVPFLMVGTTLGFIFPQAYGLQDDVTIPEGSLDIVLVMALVSTVVISIVDRLPLAPMQLLQWPTDERRMASAALGITLFGGVFKVVLLGLPEDTSYTSGVFVILHFFAEFATYGFAIAVLAITKNGSKRAYVAAGIGASFLLYAVILYGRRRPLFEFSLILLLGLWFGKRWTPPRAVMIVGLIIGALIIPNAGNYRSAVITEDGPDWSKVGEISVVATMQSKVIEDGGDELRQACFALCATELLGVYDFGIERWNGLVFNYVPAQLVGPQLKADLTFEQIKAEEEVFGFEKRPGVTYTGYTDVFRSFGYFGVLEFGLVALILTKLFRAAMAGHIVPQLVYMVSVVPAMHVVTHSTQRFLSHLVHVALFFIPILYWARQRARATPHVQRLSQMGSRQEGTSCQSSTRG